MDQHVSHENGLDVDIYYPRRDRWLQAPTPRRRSIDGSHRNCSTASSPQARARSSSATRPTCADHVTLSLRIRTTRTTCTSAFEILADTRRAVRCQLRDMSPIRWPSEAPCTFVAMSLGRPPTRLFRPRTTRSSDRRRTFSGRRRRDRTPPKRAESAQGEGEPRAAIRVREGGQSRRLIVGAIVGAMILIVAGAIAGALLSRS